MLACVCLYCLQIQAEEERRKEQGLRNHSSLFILLSQKFSRLTGSTAAGRLSTVLKGMSPSMQHSVGGKDAPDSSHAPLPVVAIVPSAPLPTGVKPPTQRNVEAMEQQSGGPNSKLTTLLHKVGHTRGCACAWTCCRCAPHAAAAAAAAPAVHAEAAAASTAAAVAAAIYYDGGHAGTAAALSLSLLHTLPGVAAAASPPLHRSDQSRT